jgi:hypothetical protein
MTLRVIDGQSALVVSFPLSGYRELAFGTALIKGQQPKDDTRRTANRTSRRRSKRDK